MDVGVSQGEGGYGRGVGGGVCAWLMSEANLSGVWVCGKGDETGVGEGVEWVRCLLEV